MMKILKKTVLIVLALIVGLIVGIVIYLQVRNYDSKNQLVSKNSSAILQISVDDIVFDVIKNNIIYPSTGLDKKSTRLSILENWKIGVDIPSKLFFFSLDNELGKFYSYQKVSDECKLIHTIINKFDLDSTSLSRDGDRWIIQGFGDKLVFIGNQDHVLISLSASGDNQVTNALGIWDNRNSTFCKVSDLIADRKGDITYTNLVDKDHYRLDFERGSIKGEAKVYSPDFGSSPNNTVRNMASNAILNAYVNIDMASMASRYAVFFDKIPVVKDFLMKSYGNYADVEWKKGEVLQKDTIITYEYDDNFESIEKETIVEEAIPNLTFTLSGNNDSFTQLPDQFFYKLSKRIEGEYMVLSTDIKDVQALVLVSTPNFLGLNYKYDESAIKHLAKYPKLELVKEVKLSGRIINNEYSQFDLDILFQKDNFHVLRQFFKN